VRIQDPSVAALLRDDINCVPSGRPLRMSDAEYIELRAHSAFSFGDGAVAPEKLAARAKDLHYTSIGLTDAADLGGVVRFAMACQEHAIKPIVGAELIVDGHPIALLARDADGCRNLGALITRARAGALEAWPEPNPDQAKMRRPSVVVPTSAPPRGQPEVIWADIATRNAGLHALTGPATGEIPSLLRDGRDAEAARVLDRWRDVFGERLAVEVQLHHAGRGEEVLAGALVQLAESNGVPWVVTNDPRYVDRPGRLVHEVLTALRAGLTIDEATNRGVLLPNGGWRLESPKEMAHRWQGRDAGIRESRRIAEQCAFELKWLRPPLPDFSLQAGDENPNVVLRRHVFDGARVRWGDPVPEQCVAQLDHELTVIAKLGFAGFFLVMWDAVHQAHRRNILCQGRGSAANSAVAYCLGVTAVDPVKNGLLFERFLSEVRVDGQTEPPDIDVDVEHDRREEVLDYVYRRWKRESAAITGMVQYYRAPNAIRDAMRAFGYPLEVADAISKRLHHAEPAAAAERVRDGLGPEFGLDVGSARGRALLTAIAAFDGLPRMRSTHPGGFVLSGGSLGEHCPIEPTAMGRTVIQFDKDDLDAVGVPKFDFLGLGALSMVRRAFDVIEARTGTRPSMYGLPQDDAKTYEMIARGDTIGMFQIESRAQIASLVLTKPEHLYDIVVQVALIRPGPIQAKFVKPYTLRRRGKEAVRYPHPDLADILERTQGIPIFQEQAMAIAMRIADYSAGEADELRRTMGNARKMPRLLKALERLRARMVDRGIEPQVAEQIAEDLQSFANYGFPESHAWSFALIAYATAWLKARHPTEFYCGLLNAWPMGFYAPSTIVHDARRHGVIVRSPCLVIGQSTCTVEDTDDFEKPALRIGWRYVRGMGDASLERLVECHKAAPFTSITDVVTRAGLSRGEGAALARAGAFAAWQPDRRRAAWEALRAAGDTLPLAPVRDEHKPIDGFDPRAINHHEEVLLDYHAVGLSTSGHPMERIRPWCDRMGMLDSAELARRRTGEKVLVAGMVSIRQQPATAKGTVFLLLEDELGTINIIVPQPLVEPNREVVRHSLFISVYGKAERGGALVSVVGARFEAIDVQAVSGEIDGDRHVFHRSRDFR
jgi:error-prone DNA polymerase